MSFHLITDLDDTAHLSLRDRALHYGDGLFETMLMRNGVIKWWSQHYDRLQRSTQRLFIECPDKPILEQTISRYQKLSTGVPNQDWIIKLIVSRGVGGRGISWPESSETTVIFLHYPFERSAQPVDMQVVSHAQALTVNPRLAGLKHLNRLDYVLASERLSRQPRFNEALLQSDQGFVVEGIVHNVFFELAGEIHTPALDQCGVAGVMRELLLKKMKVAGKHVTIGSYRLSDIGQASGIIFCNSVQGVRPVTRLDDQNFHSGPLANQFNALLNAD